MGEKVLVRQGVLEDDFFGEVSRSNSQQGGVAGLRWSVRGPHERDVVGLCRPAGVINFRKNELGAKVIGMERNDVRDFDGGNRAGLAAKPALLYQELWQSNGKAVSQSCEK